MFPGLPSITPGAQGNLEQAANLAPGTELGRLLEKRNELEARLRQVTGEESADDAMRQRFPVASFAERRAQEQAWAVQRAAGQQRSGTGRSERQLGPSPLEGRMDAGLAGRSGLAGGIGDRFSSGLGAARSALARSAEAVRPLSDTLDSAQRSVSGARTQLRDLDRQLASEGVSDAERSEVRKALHGDKIDKAGAVLDRVNAVMDRPKRAAEQIESGWLGRQRKITGAMDRYSGYAERREQQMSLERGGSGDLFERMRANRQRALERRRDAMLQEQRDEQRRQRAREKHRERQREETEG
ncbi:hypothetical protein SAMN05444390_1011385 [Marinobacterium lutimaris]|uniref:Uncharacterized protein n=1 Tax=Marinobacterium lutimaris TaxID=568106 RepID=A0A1H5XGZ5_9GAMM|nr:hypothetical protein SAMN05444390_1011385 [Marinobacterium lutimaris]